MENWSGFPESKSELNQKQFFLNLLNPKQKWFFKNFFFQFKLVFLDSQKCKTGNSESKTILNQKQKKLILIF